MKVTLNKIQPPVVFVSTPEEGEVLGWVNEYEFNDIRIQIKNQKLKGYKVLSGSDWIEIDPDGRVNPFPKEFDLMDDQLEKLTVW